MKIRGATVATPTARRAVTDDTSVSKAPWSSKHTVETLCPAFEESGSVVACEPVEGYPLTVTAEDGATTIIRCGKNLLKRPMEFNPSAVPFEECFFLKAGKYYFSVKPRVEGVWRFYVSLYYPDGTVDDTNNPVNPYDGNGFSVYYNSGRWGGPLNTNMTCGFIELVHDSYIAINYGNNETENLFYDAQLEVGSVGTEYEPYIEAEEFTAEPNEPQTILAKRGVNTLYADTGNITVSGRADTTAVIEKLTNAILALGGNV